MCPKYKNNIDILLLLGFRCATAKGEKEEDPRHRTSRAVGKQKKNKRSIPLVAMHSDRDEMPKHKLGKEKQPLLNPNEKARIFVAIRCFFLWVGVLGEGM